MGSTAQFDDRAVQDLATHVFSNKQLQKALAVLRALEASWGDSAGLFFLRIRFRGGEPAPECQCLGKQRVRRGQCASRPDKRRSNCSGQLG